MSFPGGSDGKESAGHAGDPGSISGLGRFLGEGNGNPLQYSCLENYMDQRSVVSYSLWGHKESDTTERLTHTCVRTHTHTHMLSEISSLQKDKYCKILLI